jgi:predicted secreted Zn-dependent protease
MMRELGRIVLLALAVGAASQMALAQNSARGKAKGTPKVEIEAEPDTIKPPLLELAKANLTMDEVVQYYEVSGDTVDAVRADIDAKRVKVHTEGNFDAYTRWRINWRVTNDQTGGRCTVKEAFVTVTLTITMPRLAPDAPAKVRQRWDTYWSNLMDHETMHADNGRDVGRDVSQGLIRLPSEADCATLNKRVNEFAQGIVKRGNQNDLDIDRTTRHGATQGAIFP